MLIVQCADHFILTTKFALDVGAYDRLFQALKRLDTFATPDHAPRDIPYYRVYLQQDFAPYSFAWRSEILDMQASTDAVREAVAAKGPMPAPIYKPGLIGGLIYRGPTQPHDGNAPAFVVDVGGNAGYTHDWTIHT